MLRALLKLKPLLMNAILAPAFCTCCSCWGRKTQLFASARLVHQCAPDHFLHVSRDPRVEAALEDEETSHVPTLFRHTPSATAGEHQTRSLRAWARGSPEARNLRVIESMIHNVCQDLLSSDGRTCHQQPAARCLQQSVIKKSFTEQKSSFQPRS